MIGISHAPIAPSATPKTAAIADVNGIFISQERLTPGSRAGLEARSGGKSVAVQPIVRPFAMVLVAHQLIGGQRELSVLVWPDHQFGWGYRC